jgi:hypothetical protein
MGCTIDPPSAFTGKGVEMKVTIPAWVTVHHLGFHHAGSDHTFGHIGIIRLFFFRFFACQANGLVVKNGQYSLVGRSQRHVAAMTGNRTGQFLFPLVFHFDSSYRWWHLSENRLQLIITTGCHFSTRSTR